MSRKNAALATALLALGLAGVALAGVATGSNSAGAAGDQGLGARTASVSFTTTTLHGGKVTLVVSNKGTKKHGLAIMGETM